MREIHGMASDFFNNDRCRPRVNARDLIFL